MKKVNAQEVLTQGSFIFSTTSDGYLEKNKLYRVRNVSGGKYVSLDTSFCGTDSLKGKTITFSGNFSLAAEEDVKARFKSLLKNKCFVEGATFKDSRTGEMVNITPTSRTHILVKFGKFMGIKIAGGTVWFQNTPWAVALEETKEEPKREEQPPTRMRGWTPEQTATKEEITPKKQVKLGTGASIEEQILAVVDEHLTSKEARVAMADSVEALLNEWGIHKNVRQVEVTVNKQEPIKVGIQHFKFDLVLKCMAARTNIALVGAAGSGKTTTVAKAAEALNLPFYSKSVSAQTGAHEFFGYQDAQGRYVRTLFREAYEEGGVFLLDEFDAGNPNVLAALNQATANEYCAFADGMIKKHDDFICVMAGNTFGHGANSQYVGRNKIDAATLDRFAFINFPYDEDLEYALATDKNWCKRVQAFRKKVETKKIQTIISPRATIIGGQLLANGVSEDEVVELLIYKGLNQEERNLLKG